MKLRWTLLLFTILIGSTTEAGTFRVTYAGYEYQRSRVDPALTLVMVGADARYEGTIDEADRHWSIQTVLDWNGTRYNGTLHSGVTIPESREVTCDAKQCGASAEIPDCNANDQPHFYQGIGATTILHIHGTSEDDQLPADPGFTVCITEVPDPDGTDPESPPGDGSGTEPLVIDLDRRGFHFTDPLGGVFFDLDADGTPDRVSWTDPMARDAFLVLDRNANGVIDNGTELFGDKTEQPPSSDPHGFAALTVFDQPADGGNGDGWITEEDAVFSHLKLWVDSNHDGISQSGELTGLSENGLTGISLTIVDTQRHDRFGNFLRFKSLVRLHRATTQALGVYFQTM